MNVQLFSYVQVIYIDLMKIISMLNKYQMVNNEENEEENKNHQLYYVLVFQLMPNDKQHQVMYKLELFEIYMNVFDVLHQEQFVAI